MPNKDTTVINGGKASMTIIGMPGLEFHISKVIIVSEMWKFSAYEMSEFVSTKLSPGCNIT